MLAKDIYNKHKNIIHRIANDTRNYTTGPIPQEKILDTKGNIDILFTGSETTAPDLFEKLNQITYELRGIHTHCRIIPQGKNASHRINSIHLICSEMDKEDAIELKRCLNPIREDVSKEIANFGREILKQKNKPEEINAITPLLDIVEYFYRYKKEHCKQIDLKRSDIIVNTKK